MFQLTVFVTLVLGCLAAHTNRQGVTVDLARNARVVNGNPAANGKYPFQVSLQVGGSHTCGATILNSEWVLTAAHCIYGQSISRYTVRAGTNSLNGGSVHSVTYWEYHAQYQNSAYWYNDIAVLKVNPAFSFGSNVQPTVLPADNAEPAGGASSVAIGWGNACFGCSVNPNLQEVGLVIYAHEDCLRLYGEGPTTDMVCSGRPETEQGICQGDSGGPLLVDGVQIGITSWTAIPCASQPAVWTKISHYRDWIRQRTGA